MFGYYKYYIRLDKDNNIVAAFTDGYQKPEAGDIMIKEDPERCWSLDLYFFDRFLKYKYINGKIIEKTRNEIQVENSVEIKRRKDIQEDEAMIMKEMRRIAIANLGSKLKIITE